MYNICEKFLIIAPVVTEKLGRNFALVISEIDFYYSYTIITPAISVFTSYITHV